MRPLLLASVLALFSVGVSGESAQAQPPCPQVWGCGGACMNVFGRLHQHGPLFNYGPYEGYYPFAPYGPWSSDFQYTPPCTGKQCGRNGGCGGCRRSGCSECGASRHYAASLFDNIKSRISPLGHKCNTCSSGLSLAGHFHSRSKALDSGAGCTLCGAAAPTPTDGIAVGTLTGCTSGCRQ